MRSPAEIAAEVYRREPCARTFAEDLEAHLLNGYVFSTPEYFIMGRRVRRDAAHAEIVNPWVRHDQADTWLVYLFAGNMRKAFYCADKKLPWVCFERRNKLRFYTWKEIYKKTSRFFN